MERVKRIAAHFLPLSGAKVMAALDFASRAGPHPHRTNSSSSSSMHALHLNLCCHACRPRLPCWVLPVESVNL
jgi:imidazoleglycerol phosphate dehydratase HisB